MAREFELRPYREDTYGDIRKPKLSIRDTAIPVNEARMSTVFLEKWGMVAVLPDGEDSAGRQKHRLPTPTELVDRACSIAEEANRQFESRGWMQEVPSWEELEEAIKEEEDKKENN